MSTTWRDELEGHQQGIKDAGLWRQRKTLESAQSCNVLLGEKTVLNFSSNDYLGLANNESIKAAASTALLNWGVGSGASHLVCGHSQAHHQLELDIAEFVGADQALLFANGYMANLAMASAFLKKGDLFLQDKLNHASLIDAGLSSSAQFKRYAHSDLAHARQLIESADFNRLMIASDVVFSMDGDSAPLIELQQLAQETEALLVLDDAHGFGVLGECGRGSLNSVGLKPEANVLMMGTLGKALGCYGAFVAGDSVFIEQLLQTARTYIYTTALPPSMAAATSAALDYIQAQNGSLQTRLQNNIDYFKAQAKHIDLKLMPSNTPIQPILIGDSSTASSLSADLLSQGIWLSAIRPPTVAKGAARLRVALSASHTHAQIDRLIGALRYTLRSQDEPS